MNSRKKIICPWSFSRRTVYLAVTGLLALGGCHGGKAETNTSNRSVAVGDDRIDVMASVHPLRLGMTKKEVNSLQPYQNVLVLVNAAQMNEGGILRLDSGVDVTLAFDHDDRVMLISSNDRRLRLDHDIGVGTTYAMIKARLPDCAPIGMPGYGKFVEVAHEQWALFERHEGDLTAQDKVGWIEIRKSVRGY